MDGPVLVHQIKPVKNKSVDHYAEELVYPYLTKYRSSANADRVDVVFDTYPSISLKGITREKRRSGVRRKVLPGTIVPTNWREFLRSSENKTELFRYLSMKINEVSDASCHRRPRIGRRNANLLKDVVPLLASVFVCYLKSPTYKFSDIYIPLRKADNLLAKAATIGHYLRKCLVSSIGPRYGHFILHYTF